MSDKAEEGVVDLVQALIDSLAEAKAKIKAREDAKDNKPNESDRG